MKGEIFYESALEKGTFVFGLVDAVFFHFVVVPGIIYKRHFLTLYSIC